MTAGAFELENAENLRDYDIKPKDQAEPIPPDQAALQSRIYATRGAIKLLHDQHVFPRDGQPYADEFSARVLQIAAVG